MHHQPPESEPAAVHYRQALALAEELGMCPLQAHCHRGLGTLYATAGQREQARAIGRQLFRKKGGAELFEGIVSRKNLKG